ncbi:MAG TPA: hypothetical protein VMO81_02625 [Aestuariivirgaceae bacterium]|nr:hypothetical protein [Aestuariivirgaceae bacterium]
MEASCTYVASGAWIDQVVFLSSLLVAFVGVTFLAHLRGRRLEAESGNAGDPPKPEAALATA